MNINTFGRAKTIASSIVLLIATIVYFFSAERTGSLWDVGEFILGAYKLEVVHPPGAPLFMLIGRMFTWVAEILSNNPADIAFAVNFMSGLCTAVAAMLLARVTMLLGKLALVGRDGETSSQQNLALTFAGIAAGLSMAFTTSVWFSAVEGEVYAMSTLFTVMTLWAGLKWFSKPDDADADKWLVLTFYIVGLSIGVHLLSLLTMPALGILYYLKKYKKHTLLGYLASFAAGVLVIMFVQKVVIVGIPTLWLKLEIPLVNSMGLPFHSGLILALVLIGAMIFFLLKWAHDSGLYQMQLIVMSALMVIIGFSTIGVIVIRANADTPVNMNVPSDAARLLPYLNREQYGERPFLFGPHFAAQPEDLTKTDRYGRVDDKYEIVDQRLEYKYRSSDKIFLPRIGHTEGSRPAQHRQWYEALMGKPLKGKPSYAYNIKYFINYQMGWMYWRYFMWNFAGRQNAKQGFMPWDKSGGHWASGIKFIDEARLHEMDALTDTMKNHRGRNHYYFIPLIFGILGILFHFRHDPKTFYGILSLFLITGLGLIMYSNQPPNEPRERDYVLVGSFFTFCIWIGMAVLYLTQALSQRVKLDGRLSGIVAGAMVLTAPFLMAFENYDDHSRLGHYASRDYAANFLNSLDENAVIFTYGDNDTYPLWYAQEVENIRRDVRVVNLSLIFVDWYIEKLRRKVNDSPPLKLTIPSESYRGNKRHQVFFYNPSDPDNLNKPSDINTELAFVGNPLNSVRDPRDPNATPQAIIRSKNLYIPIDKEKMLRNGLMTQKDTARMVDNILLRFSKNDSYISKDELAVMDVIASNIHERPIYFAVTCKNDKLLGLNDYMQMEGLGLRIIPVKSSSIRNLSIYGSGRVATEKVYDNVMNKWRWGNFDKKETFVDGSYAAEIQAMKITMMRTSQELLEQGKNEKAGNLAAKYFEAFPHFNFPYDESVVPFIEVLNEVGRTEEAKEHLKILADETMQKLRFYDSLNEEDFASFKSDYGYAIRAVSDIFSVTRRMNDPDLLQQFEKELGDYDISKMRD
jgi:hypothetical protein